MKMDVAFCERIESAEAEGLRGAIDFGRAAFPDRGLMTVDIAGGLMAYAGSQSPFQLGNGRAPY